MPEGPATITLAHGAGGRLSHQLVEQVFKSRFDNEQLRQGDDAAELPASKFDYRNSNLAFTTDSYVVTPLFFPGGDIGRLAVFGTVNDLAMKGARPLALSASFIIGEGLAVVTLEKVAESMAAAAREAKVRIVTGDTKVVERAACDGLFVTTAGVGAVLPGTAPSGANARPGDAVILSGTLGDHGLAVMNARGGFGLGGQLLSDAAPLWDLAEAVLAAGGVHVFRDPTRGGLATTLNEIAIQSGVAITIDEAALPVRDTVRAAAEMLGLDVLYLANEGKLVAMVAPALADAVLQAMRNNRYGRDAAVIGTVAEGRPGVALRTAIGSHRPLLMLEGESLPRIC